MMARQLKNLLLLQNTQDWFLASSLGIPNYNYSSRWSRALFWHLKAPVFLGTNLTLTHEYLHDFLRKSFKILKTE